MSIDTTCPNSYYGHDLTWAGRRGDGAVIRRCRNGCDETFVQPVPTAFGASRGRTTRRINRPRRWLRATVIALLLVAGLYGCQHSWQRAAVDTTGCPVSATSEDCPR